MDTTNVVVYVKRGQMVESVHRGHLAVVDQFGRIRMKLGQCTRTVFARSAAKPLQAIAVLQNSGGDWAWTDSEIALMCASHSGEVSHVETAKHVLGKSGLNTDALTCGAHEPWHRPTAEAMRAKGKAPTPAHNNCSGKHAGMLALAVRSGWPTDGYADRSHPVQQLMLSTVAAMCGMEPSAVKLGTDGCGVPVFGMPLARLAYAYARLGKPETLNERQASAARLIIRALKREPYYLAGSNRFDTKLIEATNGRIIGKMGAEGVYALTVPEQGIGLALKIEDGAERALYPAVTEALLQLSLLSGSEYEQLRPFHKPPVTNWRGDVVGAIEPAFTLEPAAPDETGGAASETS